MEDKISPSLILLTYKGKALLMYKRKSVVDREKHPWSFIGGVKEKGESFENAVSRWVKKEMGITIDKIEYVSDSCYHARLTDDNVNKIQREENQLLDFYSLKEIKKLNLSSATEQFVLKHGSLI